MAHDVMICHYPGDKAVGKALAARLEKKGISCWFGPRDHKAGGSYEEASMQALRESQVVCLVLSTNSSTDPTLHAQVTEAHELQIPIAALIGDMVRLPGEKHSYITHPNHIQQAGKVFASDLDNTVEATMRALEEGMASASNADEEDPYGSLAMDDDDGVAIGGIGGGSGLLELTSEDLGEEDDVTFNVPNSGASEYAAPASSMPEVPSSGVRVSFEEDPFADDDDDDDPYSDMFGDEPENDAYTPKPAAKPAAMPQRAPATRGTAQQQRTAAAAPPQQRRAPQQQAQRPPAKGRQAPAKTPAKPVAAPVQKKRGILGFFARLFGKG